METPGAGTNAEPGSAAFPVAEEVQTVRHLAPADQPLISEAIPTVRLGDASGQAAPASSTHGAASAEVTAGATAEPPETAGFGASGHSADDDGDRRRGLAWGLGGMAALVLVLGGIWLATRDTSDGESVSAGVTTTSFDEGAGVLAGDESPTISGGSLVVDGEVVSDATVPVVPSSSSTSVATTSTTTTIPTGPFAPLTGQRVPIENADNVGRALLAIKIDNKAAARPQAGINQADVVFEVRVEGGLTRFIAMFQSTDALTVGPIRSARTTDIGLLRGFTSPLFGFSGANDGTLTDLRATNIVLMPDGSGYQRDPNRPVPHNLMSSTSALYRRSGGGGNRAAAWFGHRPANEAARGLPAAGIAVSEGGTSEWVWSEEQASWLRFQDGAAHVDADGRQIDPENVVVLFAPYGTSPHDPNSPELNLVGQGDAWILSGGALEAGSWRRPLAEAPPQLVDSEGQLVQLAPGRTWVVVPRAGRASLITAGRANALMG